MTANHCFKVGDKDTNYLPILKKGTTFSSTGGQIFTLTSDVDFSNPQNEIVVANVNNTNGLPTSYAIKTFGVVQSGYYEEKIISIGDYKRFLKIDLEDRNVLEISNVIDTTRVVRDVIMVLVSVSFILRLINILNSFFLILLRSEFKFSLILS